MQHSRTVRMSRFLPLMPRSNCVGSGCYVLLCFYYKHKAGLIIFNVTKEMVVNTQLCACIIEIILLAYLWRKCEGDENIKIFLISWDVSTELLICTYGEHLGSKTVVSYIVWSLYLYKVWRLRCWTPFTTRYLQWCVSDWNFESQITTLYLVHWRCDLLYSLKRVWI